MFNTKVFPSFKAANSASDEDKAFLAELTGVRDSTGANYIGFSIFDYRSENPDPIHFLTYPMEWISHYIRFFYADIDPLLSLDYRRVSFTDWRDLQMDCEIQTMFLKYEEFGLGSNGVSVVHYLGDNIYCALALSFEVDDDDWVGFRNDQMGLFRFHVEHLADSYNQIYRKKAKANWNVTKRESECLYWVAMGKTDDQIAELMGLGKWTVVSHLKSAKYKLGFPNRAAAVALALTCGIIDIRRAG